MQHLVPQKPSKRCFYVRRMATARGKAEMADAAAYQAREDFDIARLTAKQFAPDFTQPSKYKKVLTLTCFITFFLLFCFLSYSPLFYTR